MNVIFYIVLISLTQYQNERMFIVSRKLTFKRLLHVKSDIIG